MTKQEWDKCFVWLVAAFPQWKVEAATSAVWFSEIGWMKQADFTTAVHSLMSNHPSPFPPGVFEIQKAATPSSCLHPGPEEAWGIALAADDENKSVVWTDEIAQAQGACNEQLKAGDVVGGRMAFLEKYKQLVAEAERENRPPRWWATLGFDQRGREEAQEKAALLDQQVKARLAAPDRRLLT